jgi:hypothetical protein
MSSDMRRGAPLSLRNLLVSCCQLLRKLLAAVATLNKLLGAIESCQLLHPILVSMTCLPHFGAFTLVVSTGPFFAVGP